MRATRAVLVVVVAALILVPPWERDIGGRRADLIGWSPIFAPPKPANGYGVSAIAWGTLGLELAAFGLLAAGVAWARQARD